MTEDYSVEFLVSVIESAEIPFGEGSTNSCEMEFPSKDGWKVGVFYDVGDFNYIDYVKDPEGSVIDFWWSNDGWSWTAEQWEAHEKKWEPILKWNPPRHRETTDVPKTFPKGLGPYLERAEARHADALVQNDAIKEKLREEGTS